MPARKWSRPPGGGQGDGSVGEVERVALRERDGGEAEQREPGSDADVGDAAVAALRTAVSYHRELVRGGAASPGVGRLLDDAFAQLAGLAKL